MALTLRCVDAAGAGTMVVVAAVVMRVFWRPGVTVVPLTSTQEVCTSMVVVAVPVTIRTMSLVLVWRSMIFPYWTSILTRAAVPVVVTLAVYKAKVSVTVCQLLTP